MKIVLLGAPGSGKGTQALLLTKQLGIPQISTGDLFRKNIKEATPLGLQVKQIVDNGGLVSDDLVVALVDDRLQQGDCAKGYILDGFPRSVPQAQALSQLTDIDFVINLAVDEQVIVKRMTGRRTCKQCGSIHHVDNLSGPNCPNCNGELFVRPDDNEQTVLTRLLQYEHSTKPLVSYYEAKGLLVTVNSNQAPDKVNADILQVIEK